MQIIIDTREQTPYVFPKSANAKRGTLKTGDYSLAGYEDKVTVERKTLSDAYGTIGQGRKRFTDELERMRAYEYAAIVVESSLGKFVEQPPRHSELSPKSAINSLVAWSIRYGVHVYFADSRPYATALTYNILDKFYKDKQRKAGK